MAVNITLVDETMGIITYMNFDEHTHTAFGWIGNMELLCAKGGEQRETQANELLFMIFFLSHSDTRQSGNVLNVCYLFF